MVTESLTIKEESIFAVPLTCNRDDGVVVPIPTFPEGGRVLVWAATVNMVKKQLILSAILVVFTKNSLGFAWIRLDSLGFAWIRLESLGIAWNRLESLGIAWR